MNEELRQWERLRKQARKLESDVDGKLVAFSKVSSQFNQSALHPEMSSPKGKDGESSSLLSGSDHLANSMALELESLLLHLSEVNEAMSRCLSNVGPTGSASLMHTLQRHHELLRDYTQEFRKTKMAISHSKEHAELLSSVRQDSGQYKRSGHAPSDSLLRERNAIHASDRLADDVIGQAQAAKEGLSSQRTMFRSISTRLSGLGRSLPTVNGIILQIRKKRARDVLILGLVIGVCVLILLYSVWG